jgi:hypothetical protein
MNSKKNMEKSWKYQALRIQKKLSPQLYSNLDTNQKYFVHSYKVFFLVWQKLRLLSLRLTFEDI